jgi:hypothetical protein
MKFAFGLLFIVGVIATWTLSGCTTEQAASNVLCQPSQLVRCNDCPMTGQCADTVCRGWLQCSSDGTKFEGTCSECAPDDTNDDSCASLQTCCAQSTLPASEQSSCAGTVMQNDADTCYALLNQYLGSKSCGGVTDPPPPPPARSTVSGACATLAPCCDAAYNSSQAAGACSVLVSGANDTACADAHHLYCTRPSTTQPGTDAGGPGTEAGVDATADGPMVDGGDAEVPDAECMSDGELCDGGGGDI